MPGVAPYIRVQFQHAFSALVATVQIRRVSWTFGVRSSHEHCATHRMQAALVYLVVALPAGRRTFSNSNGGVHHVRVFVDISARDRASQIVPSNNHAYESSRWRCCLSLRDPPRVVVLQTYKLQVF